MLSLIYWLLQKKVAEGTEHISELEEWVLHQLFNKVCLLLCEIFAFALLVVLRNFLEIL